MPSHMLKACGTAEESALVVQVQMFSRVRYLAETSPDAGRQFQKLVQPGDQIIEPKNVS